MHREVIVILMENHILIVRYNFIRERITYTQTINFDAIRSVKFGQISYPDSSFMGYRIFSYIYSLIFVFFSQYAYGGVKIIHGDEPSFAARWNPGAQTNEHIFVSHHLAYNDKERETVYYNCDEFIQSLDTSKTIKIFFFIVQIFAFFFSL
jgi:hypothetical protein